MNARQKAERTGLLFLALLLIGGAVLMYRGNDAVALGAAEKEGILTAEQVKMRPARAGACDGGRYGEEGGRGHGA